MFILNVFLKRNFSSILRSAIIGFYRFLDFVSNFDWKNQFLAVNFNNESLGKDIKVIDLIVLNEFLLTNLFHFKRK